MVAKKAPDDAVIVQLYEAGQSTAAIATAYNLHRTRVVRILNRAGVTMRRRGNPGTRDAWADNSVTPPRPDKRPANLLGPGFHPVEIDKKSRPLLGPAKRLPEEQQRKVARLLAIYQMRWEEQYRTLVMRGRVTA